MADPKMASRKSWWLIASLMAATALVAGGVTFAADRHTASALAPASTFGQLNLAASATVDVTCPSGQNLANANVTAAAEQVGCSAPTTTTTVPATTTTVPATTTVATTVPATTTIPVTIPATTTTLPTLIGCPQFQTAPTAAQAFCDPFTTPAAPNATRSGALDPVIWGVSHATSADNPGQGIDYAWAASTQYQCGTNMTVAPEHDVNICGGHLVTSANDNDGQTLLAMYPRQPFDYAGRTGTAEFEVTDNSQGGHGAWPSFAITDQPLPAPNDGANDVPAIADTARNSVGVNLDNVVPPATCVGAQIWATQNYRPLAVTTHADGCAQESAGPAGLSNHVEIQVNAAGIKVFMSDAGNPASLHLVADAAFAVPLTRGLVWLEDVHYNANKFGSQQTNTFVWDNLAFDGPRLPRDLGFDVPDNTQPAGTAANGLPVTSLGYPIPGGSTLTQTFNLNGTARAGGALLEFTFYPRSQLGFTYKVNGVTLTMGWPFGTAGLTYTSQTIAMPIPVADLHDGTNTVVLSTTDPGTVDTANYDLILAGAGS